MAGKSTSKKAADPKKSEAAKKAAATRAKNKAVKAAEAQAAAPVAEDAKKHQFININRVPSTHVDSRGKKYDSFVRQEGKDNKPYMNIAIPVTKEFSDNGIAFINIPIDDNYDKKVRLAESDKFETPADKQYFNIGLMVSDKKDTILQNVTVKKGKDWKTEKMDLKLLAASHDEYRKAAQAQVAAKDKLPKKGQEATREVPDAPTAGEAAQKQAGE